MPETLSLPVRIGVLLIGLAIWAAQFLIINKFVHPKRSRVKTAIALDEMIPFIPGFFIVYVSAFFFAMLPFILIANTKLFISTAIGYIFISLVSSIIHVVYPSEVQRHEFGETRDLLSSLIAYYQSTLKPYDNFPSTHLAFSVMTVSVGFMVFGPVVGAAFFIWACLIAWSTLATKQHYILDIAAGSFIGVVTVALMTLVI